jgi:glutathione S-transferase
LGNACHARFFFNSSRNSTKAAVSLEESGMAYKVVAIETRKRDQFKPECLQIKPERKGPRAQPREPL